MSSYHYLPPVLGGIGLVAAFMIYLMVRKYPGGEGKIAAIAESIHLGAMVFIRREYTMLIIFVIIVAVLLAISLGLDTMSAFLTGAFCSAAAGYIGMYTATRANVRTTIAARDSGTSSALSVSKN